MDNQEPTTVSEESIPEEIIDFEDRYKRALAELENSRKRFDTDRQQIIRYGKQSLIEDVLPILDNFTRATKAIPGDQASTPWVQGIGYIQKQLLDVLVSQGVQEIVVNPGDAFDATHHEALGTAINEEVPEDHIVEVVAPGYQLHDRVIRPAHVIVSTR